MGERRREEKGERRKERGERREERGEREEREGGQRRIRSHSSSLPSRETEALA
jgi:hypothetical protein